MFGKAISGALSGLGNIVSGVGDLGAKLYDYSPAGLASRALGINTNPLNMTGFGGDDSNQSGQLDASQMRGQLNNQPSQLMQQQPGMGQFYSGQGMMQPQQDFLSALSGNYSPAQLEQRQLMESQQGQNPQNQQQMRFIGNPFA